MVVVACGRDWGDAGVVDEDLGRVSVLGHGLVIVSDR